MRGIIIGVAIIVGTFLLAIAIGAFWLNSFIHSPAFKADVESRASDLVGGPVTIQSIDFDILHGVKLEGLSTQLDASHDGGQGALQLQVASVNCSYAWTELFQRKLRITGVTLDQPKIVLTRQPAAPAPTPGGATPSGPASGSISGPGGSSVPFQLVLDRAKIGDGTVSVRDATGASMVELGGISGDANTSGYYSGQDVTGSVRIASLGASGLQATNFSTPFTFRANDFSANPFQASAYNGFISGDYELGSTNPSVLDLSAKGLDVAQLTAATKSNSSAKLSGSLDFQSKWRGVETGDLNGEGDLQLSNGALSGVRILQQISSALKIKELNEPAISSAKTHFLVQNQQTRFIGLQIVSPVGQITGDGTIAFSGALNANLVLTLSSSAMSRVGKDVAASFIQQPDGTGSIAFQVTGTTSDPQTDLATRLIMQNTKIQKAINKALDRFFH